MFYVMKEIPILENETTGERRVKEKKPNSFKVRCAQRDLVQIDRSYKVFPILRFLFFNFYYFEINISGSCKDSTREV